MVLEKIKGALVYQIIFMEKIRSNIEDLNVGLHKSLSKARLQIRLKARVTAYSGYIHYR